MKCQALYLSPNIEQVEWRKATSMPEHQKQQWARTNGEWQLAHMCVCLWVRAVAYECMCVHTYACDLDRKQQTKDLHRSAFELLFCTISKQASAKERGRHTLFWLVYA